MLTYAVPDREAVKILWQIKRKVQEEFGVKLNLSQNDLKDKIVFYRDQSQDDGFSELTKQLLGDSSAQVAVMPASSDANTPSGPSATKPAPAKKTQRIYRGRVIE